MASIAFNVKHPKNISMKYLVQPVFEVRTGLLASQTGRGVPEADVGALRLVQH